MEGFFFFFILSGEKGKRCLFKGLMNSSGGKNKGFKCLWQSLWVEEKTVYMCLLMIHLSNDKDRQGHTGSGKLYMNDLSTH